MEAEPDAIIQPRPTEALLIAIDSSISLSVFKNLQDTAFRVARTRLLYPVGKDDLVGVIQAGSSTTDNPLAEQTQGGYDGIHVHVPLISASIRAVRAIACMKNDARPTNLLNLLDVAGDRLVSAAAVRARRKRLLLFTADESVMANLSSEDNPDFYSTCDLYREHEIQVDVILSCGNEEAAQQIRHCEDMFEDEDIISPEQCAAKVTTLRCAPLIILSKSTGGFIMSLEDALPLVDNPVPKVKRGTVKYNGVLNIGDVLKIPVKCYTHVHETKPPPGKKLSWEETNKRERTVFVMSETNRVASAKDDTALEPQQIVDAFPYGPNLVPAPNDIESEHPWHMHRNRGLDVIGFVAQSSISDHIFLSHVDVIIAMKDSLESARLLRTLVIALYSEKLGILARSVMPPRGGAPNLCYLWPRIELDRTKRTIQNCFLFAVQIPMREDVRDLPFGSLEDELSDVPDSTIKAMDLFVSSSVLKPERFENTSLQSPAYIDSDDEDEELLSLHPPNMANPNLDWFNNCIVHRLINGPTSGDFPPLSNWHMNILNPSKFISEHSFRSHQNAAESLKTCLPILPVKQRDRKSRRVHKALNGDLASIVHYLPDEETHSIEVEDVQVDESDKDGDEPPDVPMETWEGVDDVISNVTGIDANDVGDITPVEDFKRLIQKGRFRFAAASLQVVIRRVIRDLLGDEKAILCLEALRKACIEHKEPRFFNDFVSSLVQRCERKDAIGSRTKMFFHVVGEQKRTASALHMIPVSQTGENESRSEINANYRSFIDEISETIEKLCTSKDNDDISLSVVCD